MGVAAISLDTLSGDELLAHAWDAGRRAQIVGGSRVWKHTDTLAEITLREMGEQVATALGRGPAVLLKSHGAVIVGSNIVECFALSAYLEENASRQYLAMQIGTPYVFSDAEQQLFRERLGTPSLFRKTWDHYRSKL